MAIDPNLAMGAGLAMVGTLGPAIGVGLVGSRTVEGIARQPEQSAKILVNGLLFAALCEMLGLAAAFVGLKLIL